MKSARLIKKRADQVATDGRGQTGSDESLRQRIAEAAYARYEQRGREDGHDVEDWLFAESLVKS